MRQSLDDYVGCTTELTPDTGDRRVSADMERGGGLCEIAREDPGTRRKASGSGFLALTGRSDELETALEYSRSSFGSTIIGTNLLSRK